MPFSHLTLSVPCLSINRLPEISLSPLLYHVADFKQLQLGMKQPSCKVLPLKNTLPSFGICCSFARVEASHVLDVAKRETPDFGEDNEQKFVIDWWDDLTSTHKVQVDCYYNSAEDGVIDDPKEIERRKKIGLANKGRVPWNKGRKHSAETRERIRQRTKEAMMNPKVRKKMSECPRAHSDQTKAKIRSSLRQLWGKRLKGRRSREKFLVSWAESIASAAKKGGRDLQELDWDSYDNMKEEIALQQHQWAADQVKAKEMAKLQARLRAERASRAKEEKMAKLAQKRKEQEQKTQARVEMKMKACKKSMEEMEDLAVTQELKLKERLTKIHKRKSTSGKISNQDHRPWEKLNLECVKKENIHRQVSLADQIQAAKSRRIEYVARQSLPTSFSSRP